MAMRATWRGSIVWGLVSISVKLYTATEDKRVKFHQVHRDDASRIRYRTVCEAEEREVSRTEIARAYELSRDQLVILDNEDFSRLPLPSKDTIDVTQFVPGAFIDPIQFKSSYYVEPDRPVKPYVLLRDSLSGADVVAVAKITIRDREHLALLRPADDLLVLQTMYWPDEIRKPEFDALGDSTRISDQEKDMATRLIQSMTVDDPDLGQFHDDYRDALMEVINAKAEGTEPVAPAAPETSGKVIDLMSALEASVERASTETKPVAAKGAKKSEKPAKTAAKKATKKAAKKTTGKKAA